MDILCLPLTSNDGGGVVQRCAALLVHMEYSIIRVEYCSVKGKLPLLLSTRKHGQARLAWRSIPAYILYSITILMCIQYCSGLQILIKVHARSIEASTT